MVVISISRLNGSAAGLNGVVVFVTWFVTWCYARKFNT